MSVTNFRYTDESGSIISGTVATGSVVRPTVDIVNTSGSELSFAFGAQTQDANGVTVALTVLEDTFEAGESKTYSMGWMPSASGTYITAAFFWNSIDDPTAIASPQFISINVEGPTITPIPLEPNALRATAISPFEVELTFRDNGGSSHYVIERDAGNGTWRSIAKMEDHFLPGEIVTYQDHGDIFPDSSYRYRVYSYDQVNNIEGFTSYEASTVTPSLPFPVYENEVQITDTLHHFEQNPKLGMDSAGKYLVYGTYYCDSIFLCENESVLLQRLGANGNPLGEPLEILSLTDSAYTGATPFDADGDFVALIAYDYSNATYVGLVYQISSSQIFQLPQIVGNIVGISMYSNFVFVSETNFDGGTRKDRLLLYDLNNLESLEPSVISIDPQHAISTNGDINDKFLAFVQYDITSGPDLASFDLILYDYHNNVFVDRIDETDKQILYPRLSNSWLVYFTRDHSVSSIPSELYARNLETGETIQVASSDAAISAVFSFNYAVEENDLVFLNSMPSGSPAIFDYDLEYRVPTQITQDDDFVEYRMDISDQYVTFLKSPSSSSYPNACCISEVFLMPLPDNVADLSLVKSVDNPEPIVEDTVTFNISVTNNGPFPASNIAVKEQIPAALTDVQFDTSNGTIDYDTNEWSIPQLDVGQTATLKVSGTVTYPGTFANTAEIIAQDQFDPDSVPGNNDPAEDDQSTVEVNFSLLQVDADISLTKTVDNVTPFVGDTITYTLSLTNNGPEDVLHVISVSDLLPDGFTPTSISGDGDFDTSDKLWHIPSLAAGETKALDIVGTIDVEGTITNTAQVIYTFDDVVDPDSVPGNNDPNEDDQDSVSITSTQKVDNDGDGYYSVTDCDDNNASINPAATEIDDGLDNNCDGITDEGFDSDGDGFTPVGDGDCNDSDSQINPAATEVFDGVDNNCDGFVDEGFTDTDGDGIHDGVDNCLLAPNPNQADSDGDGLGDACDTPEPVKAIEDLIDTIISMDVGKAADSLISNLDAAADKLEDENPNNDSAACGMLDSFINKVDAQDGKSLTSDQAATLREQAETVIAEIGCS